MARAERARKTPLADAGGDHGNQYTGEKRQVDKINLPARAATRLSTPCAGWNATTPTCSPPTAAASYPTPKN